MFGLIWKDFKILRMQLVMLSAIFVLLLIVAIRSGNDHFPLNFMTMLPTFFTLLPCSALAQEQQENTLPWLFSLPCSRKQMVLEKYILLVISSVLTCVCCNAVLLWLTKDVTRLGNCLFFVLCGIIVQCILLPLYYKIGYQKGKIIFMILCGAFGGVIGLLSGAEIGVPNANGIALVGIFVAVLLILPISIFCSTKLMEKKEY